MFSRVDVDHVFSRSVQTCFFRRPCGTAGPNFEWLSAVMHFVINRFLYTFSRLLPLGIELAIIAPAAGLLGTQTPEQVCPLNAEQGLAITR